jgi:WD40 repeat protein
VAGPTPLDRLDRQAIPETERFPGMPPQLVAVLGITSDMLQIPVLDPFTGRPFGFHVQVANRVERVAFRPDGAWLAAVGSNTKPKPDLPVGLWLRLWELPKLEPAATVGGLNHAVLALHWTTDGRELRLCTGYNVVRLGLDGKPTGPPLALDQPKEWTDAEAQVAAFSADGKTVAIAYGSFRAGAIVVWRLDGEQVRRVAVFGGMTREALALALDPPGQRLAVGLGDTTWRLYDLNAPQRPLVLAFPSDNVPKSPDVREVTFSADGRRLLVKAELFRGRIGRRYVPVPNAQLWDVSRPRPTLLSTFTSFGLRGRFSPDGTLLAAGPSSLKRADAWGDETPIEPVEYLDLATIRGPAVSPLARFALGPSAQRDLVNPNLPTGLGRDFANDFCWAPDSRHLATANETGTIFVYRVAQAKAAPAGP